VKPKDHCLQELYLWFQSHFSFSLVSRFKKIVLEARRQKAKGGGLDDVSGAGGDDD
jgi:hypothetical protein